MGGIFGGSKSKSTQKSSSGNYAYEPILGGFGGLFGNATTGANAYQKLISGDTTDFNTFRDATGFDAAYELGSRGIIGNSAGRGVLQSGAAGKALQEYGTTLQNQYVQQYLDNLLKQVDIGYQAGNLVTGAGAWSKSKGTSSSSSKQGIGGMLGGAASRIAASDRKLKKNIVKVGEISEGLNLYEFSYINGDGPYVGVMVDEVEKVFPEALGPVVDGYGTVNYTKLEEVLS